MQVEVQFSDLQTEGEGIWKQQDIFKTTLIFEKYRSYRKLENICVENIS